MEGLNPVELYERAARRTVEVAAAVRAHQLSDPTPCAAWSVQDLIDHLVGGTRYLAAAIDGVEPVGVACATADDFRAGVEACLEGLGGPGVLERTCTSPLGFTWTVAEATAGTFMDVLVHTWDLATATSQSSELDDELVEACIAMFLPEMPERGRAAGLIGPDVSVPSDAGPQERLLAAMGRRA